jgi:hypothetical protein
MNKTKNALVRGDESREMRAKRLATAREKSSQSYG